MRYGFQPGNSIAGINGLFFFKTTKPKRFLVVHFPLWLTFFSLRNSLSNAYLKFSQLLKAKILDFMTEIDVC